VTDTYAGKWEWGGGHLEEGEAPFEGAQREWEEEVGLPLPSGQLVDSFICGSGVYETFIYQVPHEADLDLYGRDTSANPDGDHFEAVAWWDPADLSNAPNVRPELLADVGTLLHKLKRPVVKAGDARPKAPAGGRTSTAAPT